MTFQRKPLSITNGSLQWYRVHGSAGNNVSGDAEFMDLNP